jgi:nucleotide-binding universal stress UspA family protein
MTIALGIWANLTCINSRERGKCFDGPVAARESERNAMYRNLLVHIPTERSPRPAIDGSVALAMVCGAALEAIAVGYESANDVPFVAEGGVAVASLFEAGHERALACAEAALAVFELEAKAAQIDHKCRAIGASFAEAADILGSAARLADLAIVSQPELTDASNDNRMPQAILFRSGGPVLVLPYTFRGPLSFRRVGICWDGGRLAGRAMRDAMPLISKADAITVLTVNEPASVEASAERLLARLTDQGLSAKTVSLQADHSSIQPTLLSAAADEGIDLLVMGGYGHSRVQEVILGGVTRDMFRGMTLPTLMSH